MGGSSLRKAHNVSRMHAPPPSLIQYVRILQFSDEHCGFVGPSGGEEEPATCIRCLDSAIRSDVGGQVTGNVCLPDFIITFSFNKSLEYYAHVRAVPWGRGRLRAVCTYDHSP